MMNDRTTIGRSRGRTLPAAFPRVALMGLFSLLMPGSVLAQEDARAIFVELQQVKQQLQEIQQKALEDPGIQEDRAKLEGELAAAIEKIDPQADEKRERLVELQEEMEKAQQAGDQPKVSSVMEEAQEIQEALQAVEVQAMGRRNIARGLERLQEKLLKRMKEIDPKVEELIQREMELTEKLRGG